MVDTETLIHRAGTELKNNPPKVLARTRKKSGAARARKQKIAIMLSKARRAGARIPEKGIRKQHARLRGR